MTKLIPLLLLVSLAAACQLPHSFALASGQDSKKGQDGLSARMTVVQDGDRLQFVLQFHNDRMTELALTPKDLLVVSEGTDPAPLDIEIEGIFMRFSLMDWDEFKQNDWEMATHIQDKVNGRWRLPPKHLLVVHGSRPWTGSAPKIDEPLALQIHFRRLDGTPGLMTLHYIAQPCPNFLHDLLHGSRAEETDN